MSLTTNTVMDYTVYIPTVINLLLFPFRCNNVLFIRGAEEKDDSGEMAD
jgi:hypothetical protein